MPANKTVPVRTRTFRNGTCLDCGCAEHECECEAAIEAAKQKHFDRFINTIENDPDGVLDVCYDCLKLDTGYMVTNAVWAAIWPDELKHKEKLAEIIKTRRLTHFRACARLCLDCLPKRLGRQLTIDDFPPSPINDGIHMGYKLGRNNGG